MFKNYSIETCLKIGNLKLKILCLYPHQESNLDLQLRRLLLYPLSYGGEICSVCCERFSRRFLLKTPCPRQS